MGAQLGGAILKMRAALLSLIVSTLFFRAGPAVPAETRGELCLDSTFIQLWQAHLSWPVARWESLFDAFERLGVKEVVIQWSEVDGVRYFDTRAATAGPVDIILQQAERRGMHVVMGLTHDTHYWERVSQPNRASYLAERKMSNEALIAALAPRLVANRALRGWYISDEIDDLNWTAPQDNSALNTYLRGLTERLGVYSPGRGVALSGFANASTSADNLAQQWQVRLDTVPDLTQLYFQDGIGVGKLQINKLTGHYNALAREMRRHGGAMVPVVETFVQVGGPPIDSASYAARPAPIARLEQQVRTARRAGKVASFGVPEYLSPEGGEAAALAYAQWLALLDKRHEGCGVGNSMR